MLYLQIYINNEAGKGYLWRPRINIREKCITIKTYYAPFGISKRIPLKDTNYI